MDAADFDRLTKTLSGAGTRRRLLRLLTALPLGVTLAALLGDAPETTAKKKKQRQDDDHGSSHRRQRRRAHHRHRPGSDKGKDQGKGKGKSKKACATAGQTPNQGKRKGCCAGLNPDGSGRCTGSAPAPSPGCTGLKPDTTGATDTKTQGLQEAIDATEEGSTLTLCAGTWLLEETVKIEKALTLVGAGAGQTFLDGQETVRVLETPSVPEPGVLLRDLTITNGRASVGEAVGGGILNVVGVLTLSGVHVTGNIADESGGGIYNDEAGTLTLQNGSRVSGNHAAINGGGIYSESVADPGVGEVTLGNDCRVSGNSAETKDGGGIFNNSGTLTLQNGSRVSGNSAEMNGGGIHNQDGFLFVESGSIIGGDTTADPNTKNTAGFGGGIFNQVGEVTLRNESRVLGNTGETYGGGIYNYGGTVTLLNGSRVVDNTAIQGGGIFNADDTFNIDNIGIQNVADEALVCNNTSDIGGECGGIPPVAPGQCPNTFPGEACSP